ncbi:MAG: cation:proton antiporter [Candidatus Kerfeldbacteria bacterium]|nr:cation:proton antiporter [Candidatus Kerfeldbacteria bacterium]
MSHAFLDLTLIIVVAALFGLVARAFRQPTMVAYLLTGVVLAASGVFSTRSSELFEVMATLGVTLLLFLVGLQMRLDNFGAIGKASLLGGAAQIIITGGVGFFIVRLLGFEILPSLYIAFALTFSSTIVVIRLLNQLRDTQSLYGRIVVGFLIVQDIVAIILLIFLAGFNAETSSPQFSSVALTLGKSIALFAVIYGLSNHFFPWLFSKLARTQELIFVMSIAWALGLSAFVASEFIGLSVEIGGFLAGLALAKSLQQFQIESQLRPLRDFFILIFFIILGSSLVIKDIQSTLAPAVVLSIFVIVGNPLIMLAIMGMLGYRKKTSFFISVTTAQVSEFSLILMAMGLAIGHVTNREVSLVTMVAVFTMMLSTYLILHGHTVYKRIQNYLNIFEKKNAHEKVVIQQNLRGPIILVGAHRLGGHLLHAIDKQKLVVVEFDPIVVKQLQQQKYKVVYGDITDTETLELVHVEDAYILISTIPSLEDNIVIVEKINALRKMAKRLPTVIVTAYNAWEARHLYEAGADYVVLPHFLGGKHLASLVHDGRIDNKMLSEWRRHDQRVLTELSKTEVN